MKKVLLNSFLLLLLLCFFNSAYSQELAKPEMDKIGADKAKKELLEKYGWVKSHLEDKEVLSIKELSYSSRTKFIIIETKKKKVMYDSEGNTYCTESAKLNCVEHYKLEPGTLTWTRS